MTGTKVSAGATRGQIEDLLIQRGIEQFAVFSDRLKASIAFAYSGLTYRLDLTLPDPESKEFTEYRRGSVPYAREPHVAKQLYTQEVNRRWRALYTVIKAKLIAVEEKITTFEREFLAYIVTHNGQVFGDHAIPQLVAGAKSGKVPTTLALPGGG